MSIRKQELCCRIPELFVTFSQLYVAEALDIRIRSLLLESGALHLTTMRLHVEHGTMKKLQILYPEPQLEQLRRTARHMDRPVSEIVREATADWLRRWAPRGIEVAGNPPEFSLGSMKVNPADLRERSYSD